MDSIDQMNEYYEKGIHVGYLNRLERAIGLTETTADEWVELDKKDFCHLFLLAETRILRLTEELETLKNEDRGVAGTFETVFVDGTDKDCGDYWIIMKDDRKIGTVWFIPNDGWQCELYKTGMSWGSIDSKEDAIKLLLDESQ